MTIGDVAAHARVSVALLRSWERRYGFPTPDRRPSGHRRYSGRDVEQIREVLRYRDDGMTLDAAIRSLKASEDGSDRSIFPGLRRRWPDLPVHVLSKRAMLAISRAIEDECCARAQRPVLVGGFQTDRLYRQSEHRWQELARTAAATLVYADFPDGRRTVGNVVESPLPHDSALRREWAVVCDAPDATACVVGLERLGGRRTSNRWFEAIWSVDPVVVRSATEIAATLAGPAGVELRTSAAQTAAHRPTDIWNRVAALTNRIVSDLDR